MPISKKNKLTPTPLQKAMSRWADMLVDEAVEHLETAEEGFCDPAEAEQEARDAMLVSNYLYNKLEDDGILCTRHKRPEVKKLKLGK